MIHIRCHQCGEQYHADEAHAGRQIGCRKCGRVLSIGLAGAPFYRNAEERPPTTSECAPLEEASPPTKPKASLLTNLPRRFVVAVAALAMLVFVVVAVELSDRSNSDVARKDGQRSNVSSGSPAVGVENAGPAMTRQAEPAEQVFQRVSASLVVVHVSDAAGKHVCQGSGIVASRGTVITNCHVAQAGTQLKASHLGKSFAATLQYADTDRDLCQLSVPMLDAPPFL